MNKKVTDPEYRLPVIEALANYGTITGGRSMPLTITGVDRHSGNRNEHYVLKWQNAHQLTKANLFNELVGAWIAKELDITCGDPVLINISPDFVEKVMAGQEGYKAAKESVGINFGTVFISGLQPFFNQFKADEPNIVNQALMIFVFDLFVDNADRGQAKPNLFFKKENLIALDHELIFSFLSLIFIKTDQPWLVFGDLELYNKHPLLPFLKTTTPDVSVCTEKLTRINDNFWDCVNNWLPQEWKSENLNKIKKRLDLIVSNKDIFAEQISQIINP